MAWLADTCCEPRPFATTRLISTVSEVTATRRPLASTARSGSFLERSWPEAGALEDFGMRDDEAATSFRRAPRPLSRLEAFDGAAEDPREPGALPDVTNTAPAVGPKSALLEAREAAQGSFELVWDSSRLRSLAWS